MHCVVLQFKCISNSKVANYDLMEAEYRVGGHGEVAVEVASVETNSAKRAMYVSCSLNRRQRRKFHRWYQKADNITQRITYSYCGFLPPHVNTAL